MSRSRKKSTLVSVRQDQIQGWLFTAPALLMFLVFVLIPTFAMLILSFTRYKMLTPPEYIGLENYVRIFSRDSRMSVVTMNTIRISLISVTLNVVIGIILALLITNRKNGVYSYVIRLFYFFPNIVAPAFAAIVWAILLAKDTGVINYYLHRLLGLGPYGFLTDAKLAFGSIVGIDVWRNVGFIMFILLAGIRAIDQTYYEAAALDGASTVQQAFRITIPLLTPSVLLVMVINIIGQLKIFDIPNIMTEGGPNNATRTVAMYIYDTAFTKLSMGYACSISVLFVMAIMAITILQFTMSSRWVNYD